MKTLAVKHLDAAAIERLKHLDGAAIADRLAVQSEAYHRLHTCKELGCRTRIHPKFVYCG